MYETVGTDGLQSNSHKRLSHTHNVTTAHRKNRHISRIVTRVPSSTPFSSTPFGALKAAHLQSARIVTFVPSSTPCWALKAAHLQAPISPADFTSLCHQQSISHMYHPPSHTTKLPTGMAFLQTFPNASHLSFTLSYHNEANGDGFLANIPERLRFGKSNTRGQQQEIRFQNRNLVSKLLSSHTVCNA